VILWFYAILPFWQPGITSRFDMLNHIYRLFQLDSCWHKGVFYPRLAPDFAFGYGEPLFQFFPPLAFYVAEFFHLVGLGLIESIKATFSLALLLSGFGMYLYVLTLLRERTAALLAAITYMYAPYHLLTIYERGALLEASALSLLPFILWSFHQLYERGHVQHLLLTAGILAALTPTHNITALLFMPFLMAYLLLLFLRRPHARGTLLCIASMTLALALAAFYWVPALLEAKWAAVSETHMFSWHFAAPSTVVQRSLIFDYWGPDRTHFGLAYSILALAAIGLLTVQPRHTRYWMLFFSSALATCLVLQLSVTQRLWSIVPLAGFLQFPWRLLGIASLSTAVLVGSIPRSTAILVNRVGLNEKIASFGRVGPHLGSATLIAVLLILTSTLRLSPGLSPLWTRLANNEIDFYSLNETGRSGDLFAQFLPVWVKVDVADIPEGRPQEEGTPIVLPFTGVDIQVSRHGAQYFDLRTSSAQAFPLLFHVFYFPGWQAYVDGERVRTYPSSPLGLVTLAVPSGEHRIMLRFEDTPLRRASKLLSALALCSLVAISAHKWKTGLLIGSLTLLLLVGLAAWHTRPFVFTRSPSRAEANLEGKVRLLGYTLDKSKYCPGEIVGVTLYWLGLQEMSEDYTVFVHLTEEDSSRVVAQHDSQPAYNFTPTTRWKPGEIVVDRHRFIIESSAPPGEYNIFVGMYLLSTLQRLEVLDTSTRHSHNAVFLTPVSIQETTQ
jgi:hypothetical protein